MDISNGKDKIAFQNFTQGDRTVLALVPEIKNSRECNGFSIVGGANLSRIKPEYNI